MKFVEKHYAETMCSNVLIAANGSVKAILSSAKHAKNSSAKNMNIRSAQSVAINSVVHARLFVQYAAQLIVKGT